eukprot:429831-Hanusia_phi.AAC.1
MAPRGTKLAPHQRFSAVRHCEHCDDDSDESEDVFRPSFLLTTKLRTSDNGATARTKRSGNNRL